MKTTILALLSVFFLTLSLPGQVSALNVRERGARGDGQALETEILQKAIDAVHAQGGGVVHFPAGLYLSGSLRLRSGVTLDLAEGATLRASSSLAHYQRGHWPAFILAKGEKRIGLTGKGTLDGNSQELVPQFARIEKEGTALEFFPMAVPGESLDLIGPTGVETRFDPYALQAEGKLLAYIYGNLKRPYEFVRPQVIEFWGCSEVLVKDLTIRNAACWVQTYRDCEDLRIEGIRVRSTDYWNNDGLDLVDCRRVLVRDCDIDSADDALCLKSDPRGAGCEDIRIERCSLRSRASALKFGSASHKAFRRIHASDLTVRDTYRSVVALQSVDGGVIEDVTVERVRATNTGNAFLVRLGHRSQHKAPGKVQRVVLRDFDVEVPRLAKDYVSETGRPHNLIPASMVGLPGTPIDGVRVERVRVRYGGGADATHAQIPLDRLDSVPENERQYPEFCMWGELPCWGLYLRHAKGVVLQDLVFELAGPDFRPALVADDAPGLRVERLKLGTGGGEPLVVFKDSPGADLFSPVFPPGVVEPLRVLSQQ